MTEQRDWQKDLESIRDYMASDDYFVHTQLRLDGIPLVEYMEKSVIHLLAEKERADQAEGLWKAFEATAGAAGQVLRKSEAREQNLQEVIDWIMHKFETEWTYIEGTGEVVDEILYRFESINFPEEGTTVDTQSGL